MALARESDFWEAVQRIRSNDDRFEAEVYPFVMEALEYTINRIGQRRHVVAGELLDGLCRYARERFGLLAPEVLDKWGVRSSGDVGRAVFHLVEAGVLARRETDCIEDFDAGFELQRALRDGYLE